MPVNRIIINYATREITLGEELDYIVTLTLKIGPTIVKGTSPMALILRDSEEFEIQNVEARSKKGNPAAFDGPVTYSSSDESVLSVTVTAGKAVFKAVGPVGTAQAQGKIDADLGEGVKEVIGVIDVQVIAGEAATLVLTPSAVREQV